mmetsp:Transcript_9036/g.24110  ORF Transcript_9036/g.24110 Transcript_9036/m.24110 type:complete len:429 (-) Transcript_9036:33-1319(-)
MPVSPSSASHVVKSVTLFISLFLLGPGCDASRVQGRSDSEFDAYRSDPESGWLFEGETAEPSKLYVKIVADDFCDDVANKCVGGQPKLRRPTPTIKVSSFSEKLTEMPDGQYIVQGAINGWAAWQGLPLRAITCLSPKRGVHRLWDFPGGGAPASALASLDKYCKQPHELRARLEVPAWFKKGWSESSPGFLLLAHHLPQAQYLLHGEDIVKNDPDFNCKATRAHVFAHNYGDSDSSDVHVGVLVEWDKGCNFTTVFELAWQNGLGGYGGRTNWNADKWSSTTWLFQSMIDQAPGMVQPWINTKSEIRAFDISAKDAEQFSAYLRKYSAEGDHEDEKPRFANVEFPAVVSGKSLSGPVRNSFRSRREIMRALLNYIGKSDRYSLATRMCQTFAADFYAYLTNHKTTTYSRLARPMYTPYTHWFLYDPV